MNAKLFEKGARVAFVGDSITANGFYIAKIFDYYREHFPELGVKMYNIGVPGDSAKGCVIHERLKEDVYRVNPTEIVLMFGMNDCRRAQFGLSDKAECERITLEARDIHRENMIKLCEAFTEKHLPITLCSATPYDEYTAEANVTNLMGCNGELRNYFAFYGEWLADFGFKNIIDFNTPMVKIIKELEALGAPSIIGGDRVHPTPIGHDVMAALFLRGQGITDIKEPTACGIAKGEKYLPALSDTNKERYGHEGMLRNHLAYIDFNNEWGQKGMTLSEKVSYWKEHVGEMKQKGEFQFNAASDYIEYKPKQGELFDAMMKLTDRMAGK